MQTPPKWTEFPKYPVVAGTIFLACAVTAAWWAHLDVSALTETADVQRGELWKLVTSIFLHVDVLHLLFNVYWFWMFGTLIEQAFGHVKTALTVVLFALGSGALQYALDGGGVGLSGVSYGLFGMLWVLSRHDERFRGIIGRNIAALFVGWFFICVLATWAKIYTVGNVAHAAGAGLGVLLGYAITVPRLRLRICIALSAFIVSGIWGATLGRSLVNISGKAAYDESKLGYDALMRNDNTAALRWLNEAARLDPKSAYIWYDLGIAHARQGNLAAARAAYQKAHDLEPANANYAKALTDAQ
jgi:membrane associated rhomboid family serine protease